MKKKIFISGASKGIGFAIAKKFLENEFDVAISASSQSSLAVVNSGFPEIQTYRADMSKKDQVLALSSWIDDSFGPLDVLVNNVGKFVPGAIHSESDEQFENMMLTNLSGSYYLTKRMLKTMMDRKAGTIFNICSIASIVAYPNGGSYSISKHALLGFSKVLREEMKPFGIRVISILPGATLTDSWAGSEYHPDRLMQADDVASIVWDCYKLSSNAVVEEVVIRPQLGDL